MNMMNWVGQTLGQYRIEAPLDAGGMGQVFRGVHLYLNRPVAIKIMHMSLADDPRFQACFLQEARAAAALKHPNIVEIYEFNEQGGHFYLVMELMTDGSLRSLLRERATGQPWPLSLGLELTRQAALGLAEAHAHGMVHGDIKPDNLLLSCVDSVRLLGGSKQYQLRISDFGLAGLAVGSGMTMTGAPMGTLAYMSPEQCRGGNLDGRSDLYSLGIVLYQIATGYLPFQIATFEEAFQKHVRDVPLPPSQVRSDVPIIVEEIILRCLAKKPEERYATGAELALALQRALMDQTLGTVTWVSLPLSPLQGSTVVQPPYASRISAEIVSTLPDATARSFVPSPANVSPTQVSATMVRSDCIGLAVSSRMLSITPGQSTSIQLKLTNLGSTVDSFTTTVEGVPQEWMQGLGQEVQLRPGMRKFVEINVNVARVAQNLAQEYPVSIRAYSRENPGESVTVKALWKVLPFKEDALRIEPRRASGRGAATYAVALRNSGNTPVRYALSGGDDRQEMDYQFGVNSVNLGPGQETRVRLAVHTRQRWLGRRQHLPFQVHVHSADSSIPLSAPGEFVNKALLPGWLLAIALIMVATIVGLASTFGLPISLLHTPSPPTPVVSITPTPTRNWTPQNSGTGMYLLGITWSGTQFVAVGYSGTILTSSDAIDWATQNAGIANNLEGVTWANVQAKPLFVAVGDSGTILTSPNGINWTQQSSPTTKNLNAIIWTGSQFVAVGDVGTILTSSDGINWTLQDSGTIDKLGGIAQNNSQLIAVGGPSGGAQGNAVVLTSSLDGTNWTPREVSTTNFLRRVAWSGFRFVAVGNQGTIFASTDGVNWVQENAGNSITNLGDIVWSGSEFVVVGDSGSILTSADGINWTRQRSVTPRYLRKIFWAGSRYVVVGANGTILTSP